MGRACIQVTPELLLELVKPGERHYIVSSDIPPDATFVDASYHAVQHAWLVVFESPALPDTPRGEPLPLLDAPQATRLHQGDVAAFLEGRQ